MTELGVLSLLETNPVRDPVMAARWGHETLFADMSGFT